MTTSKPQRCQMPVTKRFGAPVREQPCGAPIAQTIKFEGNGVEVEACKTCVKRIESLNQSIIKSQNAYAN